VGFEIELVSDYRLLVLGLDWHIQCGIPPLWVSETVSSLNYVDTTIDVVDSSHVLTGADGLLKVRPQGTYRYPHLSRLRRVELRLGDERILPLIGFPECWVS